jgi:Family of unknown function (DUF6522)
MSKISFADQTIQIYATLIANGLRMDQETLRKAMQEGHVTRTVEKGEGDVAGHFQVTSHSPSRRMRLLFDAEGTILQTSCATQRPNRDIRRLRPIKDHYDPCGEYRPCVPTCNRRQNARTSQPLVAFRLCAGVCPKCLSWFGEVGLKLTPLHAGRP